MKYTALRAFEKHLEGSAPSNFAPVYMVLGKESGERSFAIESLTSALRRSKPDSTLRSFQGEVLKAVDLARELNTSSFFSAKEIIIIHDADSLKKEATEWLTDYFLHPNPHVTLILNASAILGTTRFYKQAEKVGVILDCAEEKPWEKEKTLSEWVTQLISIQGKKISVSNAQAFVKYVGTDRIQLKHEIDKLLCYIGSRPEIILQDIHTLCIPGPSGNEWQLGEALTRLDAAAALKIVQDLIKEGASFFALIRQLRTQMQTGCQIASILTSGAGPEGVAQEFPYLKGRLLDQKVQLSQNYGFARFKKALMLIDEAELAAKNGMDDHELLADLTIIKLTG